MLKLLKQPDLVNSINKYLAALLLLFVPLYPKFPLLSIPGSQVAIRLEDFVLLGTAIIWIGVNNFKLINILRSKLAIAIGLFLLVSLLSVLSGAFLTDTASPLVGLFHWVRRVQYIFPLFIGLTAVNKKEDLYFFVKVLAIVIVFAFIYGVGQKHFQWPIITTQNPEYARGVALFYVPGSHLASTFAGHYDLASFLVLVSPIFSLLVVSPKDVLKKLSITPNVLISRLLFIGLVVMTLWLLVNAASRISVAAYLGSMSFALLLARKYKWIPIFVVVSVLFIITSSKLMDRYVQIFEVYVRNMLSTEIELVDSTYAQEFEIPQRNNSAQAVTPEPVPVFEDRSTSIRLNIEWPRAIRAVQKNPILGTGYSSITLATDNDYLRMLGEIGILGTLAFFLIFARVFEKMLKAIPVPKKLDINDVFIVSAIAAFPGILLNMVFIDILEASKFAICFWLMIGVAIATISTFYEKETTGKNNR